MFVDLFIIIINNSNNQHGARLSFTGAAGKLENCMKEASNGRAWANITTSSSSEQVKEFIPDVFVLEVVAMKLQRAKL